MKSKNFYDKLLKNNEKVKLIVWLKVYLSKDFIRSQPELDNILLFMVFDGNNIFIKFQSVENEVSNLCSSWLKS